MLTKRTCVSWKDRLADLWSKFIVKKEQILITDEFIKEMRSAANKDQAFILDEIFGKEEPIFRAGEWIIITDFGKANPGKSFKLDGLYKLSKDFNKENGLIVEMDNSGNIDNGWGNAFEMGIKIRKARRY